MPADSVPGQPPAHSPGARLREWGREHPTLQSLGQTLPAYPTRRDAMIAPGLYLDGGRTPWVSIRGEIRVSLARLVSVTSEGRHLLVGQVQVTAIETALEETTEMRFYTHQPQGVIAREADTESEWWLTVLDLHYGSGGPPVMAVAGVTA